MERNVYNRGFITHSVIYELSFWAYEGCTKKKKFGRITYTVYCHCLYTHCFSLELKKTQKKGKTLDRPRPQETAVVGASELLPVKSLSGYSSSFSVSRWDYKLKRDCLGMCTSLGYFYLIILTVHKPEICYYRQNITSCTFLCLNGAWSDRWFPK